MAGQVPVNSQEKRCFVYLFIVKPLNNPLSPAKHSLTACWLRTFPIACFRS